MRPMQYPQCRSVGQAKRDPRELIKSASKDLAEGPPLQVAQHILWVGADDQPVFGDVDGVEVPLDALDAVVFVEMVDGGLGIFAGADEVQAQPSSPGRR